MECMSGSLPILHFLFYFNKKTVNHKLSWTITCPMYACMHACRFFSTYCSNSIVKVLKDSLLDLNAVLLPIKERDNEMKKVALPHVVWRLLLKLSCCNVIWCRPMMYVRERERERVREVY